jgi:anti-sigma regulatory factor (Ser/Thr protein kinase)
VLERELAVPASLESVRSVGLWLHDVSREAGLPYDVVFAFDVAVHEAVENIARHGRSAGAEPRVRMLLRRDRDRVEVVISDDGVPFDPLSIPRPVDAERIEDVVLGGRGVHLMRHFMDELHYRHEAGRNVLTLVRCLPPRPEDG